MTLVKAGVFQFDAREGDTKGNLEKVLCAIRQAAELGVNLLVLPEMWSCSFDYQGLYEHAGKTPEILDALAWEGKKHGILIAGSLPEIEDGRIFNSLYLIDSSGKAAAKYRKIHLFPLIQEDRHLSPGSRPVICRTFAGTLGFMVCFDLRFPELCRTLALKGAEIIVVPGQWPSGRIEHWNLLLRARAVENQVFVIGANRHGQGKELFFSGSSRVISPDGEVLAASSEPGALVTASIDLSVITRSRSRFNCLELRDPGAYEFRDRE